jgi:hypothetical protein
MLLLVAHDSLIPFALKVQDQTTTPFGGGDGVNVHVKTGGWVQVGDADITWNRGNAGLRNTDLLADVEVWRSPILHLGREQDVAVGVEQRSRELGKRGIPMAIVAVSNLDCANTPSLIEARSLVSI